MLQLNIKESEIGKQDIVQQLYEQRDINGNAFYDYQAKDFHINLSSNNLYDYLQDGNVSPSQIEKANIFEDSIKDSLQFAEEMYTSYSQNGIDTTELRKEILSERKGLEEISGRIKSSQKQNQITGHEQYNNTFQNQTTQTNLPTRKNRFSKFFNQVRARFSRQGDNTNSQQRSPFNRNKKETQQQEQDSGYLDTQVQTKKTQTLEKKSWKLGQEEKARIQRETAGRIPTTNCL